MKAQTGECTEPVEGLPDFHLLYMKCQEKRKGLQYKYSQMLGDQKISSVNVEDVCPMQFKHRHASVYMAAVCRRSQMPFQR